MTTYNDMVTWYDVMHFLFRESPWVGLNSSISSQPIRVRIPITNHNFHTCWDATPKVLGTNQLCLQSCNVWHLGQDATYTIESTVSAVNHPGGGWGMAQQTWTHIDLSFYISYIRARIHILMHKYLYCMCVCVHVGHAEISFNDNIQDPRLRSTAPKRPPTVQASSNPSAALRSQKLDQSLINHQLNCRSCKGTSQAMKFWNGTTNYSWTVYKLRRRWDLLRHEESNRVFLTATTSYFHLPITFAGLAKPKPKQNHALVSAIAKQRFLLSGVF